MKIGREKGGTLAGHGTDRTDFPSFDVSHVAPYNIGLHFGTRAVALDRLDIRNPFRISVDAFNRRLNVSLRNLFRSLGYDGLVYANEIESPMAAA